MKTCDVCKAEGKTVKSIPGLIKSIGLCQYHWNVRVFGKTWADKCLTKERN